MRFCNWRGVAIAVILAAGLAGSGLLSASPAQAGGLLHLGHTIPRETLAQDYRTGGVYYAPPIPYGHYVKDPVGCIHAAAGLLAGHLGKLCGLCQGKGCGSCDGAGCFHGDPCGSCGGLGCGGCGGLGLLNKHHGLGRGLLGRGALGHGLGGHAHQGGSGGGLLGHHHKGGICESGLCGPSVTETVLSGPSTQIIPSAQGLPSAQTIPSSLCGDCDGKGHGGGLLSRSGKACGSCKGLGRLHSGRTVGGSHHPGISDPCGPCGGKGCGFCGGLGKHLGKHLGKKHRGDLCGACGGLGCGLCGIGLPRGLGHSLLNKLGVGGVEYFVGPGGPVPLTPGYVPYVVPVRSPRDFFAFPPYLDRSF